jgi:hypothetical protein
MKKISGVLCLMILVCGFSFGQTYTHADTLRGSNGPGRSWWDATKYDLHVKFNLQDSSISGYNIISYHTLDKRHPDFFQISTTKRKACFYAGRECLVCLFKNSISDNCKTRPE